ncbi:MAG: beta-galactosidase [Armatimonadota bacterium]
MASTPENSKKPSAMVPSGRLPIGAPMFYSAGNDVGFQPVVPPGEKLYSRQEAEEAINRRFMLAAKEGLTALEPYVKWWICEPQQGKWDFSYYDLHDQAAKKAGIRWLPFLIAGPAYATPPWFKASKEHVPAVCLEHGEATATQSIWNPHLRPHVSEFIRRFAEHFDETRIESVLLGISGDFGETLYTAGGNLWTYLDAPYHVHSGYWCGDSYARADFQRAMSTQYKSIASLNKAWGTSHVSFDVVQPFLPKEASNRRARLDLQRWYCAAMTDYLEFWLRETKRYLPKSRIVACVGGDGQSMLGADITAQAELVAKYKAGLRVTNEASDYGMNYMLTRQVGTSCRFYGTFYGFEPAGGVSDDAIAARVYNATASGADELFTYDPEPEGERGARYRELRKYLVKREPDVDVALFLNRTSWDLGLMRRYWQTGSALRSVTDFDIVDERLISAGVLKHKRVLFWLDGPVIEGATARELENWVRAGGLLVLQCNARVETVEAGAIGWLPAVDQLPDQVPDRYRVDVGSESDVMNLAGQWHGPEIGNAFVAPDTSYRWSTDGSAIDLPVPGKNGITVAVRAALKDPQGSEQLLLVDGKVVAKPQGAGLQVISFHLSSAQIAGRKSIRLQFGGQTWQGSDTDLRKLGMAVASVAVGSGDVDAEQLTRAPRIGMMNTLSLDQLAKPPYTKRLGLGAVVSVPRSDLEMKEFAREAVFHPGRFLPAAKAPYPMVETDGTVYVTRFRDGSVLLLNTSGTPAKARYAGKDVQVAAHSILGLRP